MVGIRDRISALENRLTLSEQKIGAALLKHPEPFLLALGDLAKLSGVSDATVVRFCRRLGFGSYQELKVALAQESTETTTSAIYEDVQLDDPSPAVLAKVFGQSIDALRTTEALLNKQAFDQAAEWVTSAKRLYFLGVGASGSIALDAAHKFLRLGGTSVALTDSHIAAITASHLSPADTLIAISHSGESVEVLESVKQALQHTPRVVALTGYSSSSLCQLVPTALITAAREARFRSDAMASRLAQLALIDSLYVIAVCRRGQEAVEAVNRSRLAVARRKT